MGIYTLATNILGNDCIIENGIEKESLSVWIMEISVCNKRYNKDLLTV